MTIQDVIRKHITNEQVKTRIHYSFQSRSVGMMSLDAFIAKYDYDKLLGFPGIGKYTTDLLMDAISKEKY